MNTPEQEATNQTTAGEPGAPATVETPAPETTETPADDQAQAPEAKATEPKAEVTPKAVKEERKKSIGDDPLYKAIRRAESKSDEALKLIRSMLKNSGQLSEEDSAKLEATEKEAEAAKTKAASDTRTRIIWMAGKAGVDVNDPSMKEVIDTFNTGDFEAAIEAAERITGATKEKSMEAKPAAKVYATQEEVDAEVARQLAEKERSKMKVDAAMPSGGKRVYTQDELNNRAFYEANRDDILKAQIEGRIK